MIDECVDHGCKGYGLGYATAWIKLPCGTKKPTTKHRKVYYEATGELPEVVRHKCDNPRCVNPEHLEGGTQKDNMDDMKKRNRSAKGLVNGAGKLTPEQVTYIRTHYVKNSKEFGTVALGRKFGVHNSAIGRVVRGVYHTAAELGKNMMNKHSIKETV